MKYNPIIKMLKLQACGKNVKINHQQQKIPQNKVVMFIS